MPSLSILVFCASFLTAQTHAAGQPLSVHLRVDQDGGLPTTTIGDAVDETRRIWRAAGVTLTSGGYTDLVPAGAATVSLRILKIRPERQNDEAVLAWVVLRDGAPAPTLFVSLPGLLDVLLDVDFLGRRVRERPAAVVQMLIARTIGRVAAHELGHYLLQSTGHPGKGLMRARYRTTDLIGNSLEPFEIPRAERISFRREVARMTESQQRR